MSISNTFKINDTFKDTFKFNEAMGIKLSNSFRINDTFKDTFKFNEAMGIKLSNSFRINDTFKDEFKFNEAMGIKLSDSLKINDTFKDTFKFNEAMGIKLSNSFKINDIFKDTFKLNEAMRIKLSDSFKTNDIFKDTFKLDEALRIKLSDSIYQNLEIWSDLGINNYKEQIVNLSEQVSQSPYKFTKIIEGVSDKEVINNDDLIINTNGEITINKVTYQPSQVTDAFIALEEALGDETNSQQALANLFRNYSHQNPIIMWILDKIILTLFLGMLTNYSTATPSIIQNYNTDIQYINPQYTISTIVKRARPILIGETMYDNYKFVRTNSLKVYTSKFANQYSGELKFGQAARVLVKKRDWIYIETVGDNGEYIEGWVKSKYLK